MPLEPDALGLRLREGDFDEVMAAIEAHLAESEPMPGWGSGEEGLLFLQSLGTGVAPLAGLDVEAGMASARTFLENFPIYGLPLGDVDQRAARWLSQLLDTGSIRSDYRDHFRSLAQVWDASYPLAAEQLRSWSAGPPPADPRQDEPWLQVMIALARTQL